MAKFGKYNAVLKDNLKPAETIAFYANEATEYDKDMLNYHYQGAEEIAEVFFSLNVNKDAKILDMLCGTGLVAGKLKTKGYFNIDGIDGSKEMLELARKQQLYKNYLTAVIDPEGPIPIPDETYDVLIMSGALAPGHLYPTIFPEFIRITKHGGIILWSMSKTYIEAYGNFKDIDDKIEALSSKWQYCFPAKTFKNYNSAMEGRIYAMKRL